MIPAVPAQASGTNLPVFRNTMTKAAIRPFEFHNLGRMICMECTNKTVADANVLPDDSNVLLGIDIGSTTVKIAILEIGRAHV